MDGLLTSGELEEQQDKFFARYKLKHPAEVAPSDALVSRVTKENATRKLTLREVFKTKTQAQPVTAQRKKRTLTGGVTILEGEP